MKAAIHPDYKQVKAHCRCGVAFEVGSSYSGDSIELDTCNECYPFKTGSQSSLVRKGRVENFMRRYNKSHLVTKMNSPNSEKSGK